MKYDTNSNKTNVTLAGKDGTTITNVKDGALTESSTDVVTGKQLYAEQTARVHADDALNMQVKTNADAISKEKTDRADAISALKTELTSDSTNSSLASKANVNASNIGRNITTGATDDKKSRKTMPNFGVKPWDLVLLKMAILCSFLAVRCIANFVLLMVLM